MNQEAVGIAERPATGITDQERRWAILRWLSAKLDDAPHGDILDAAERFEEFVAARITGQKPSKKDHSKIEEIEATVRRIVAGAAEAELDIQELGPPKLRKPNRISRNPPKWPHKR